MRLNFAFEASRLSLPHLVGFLRSTVLTEPSLRWLNDANG
jgi:hypothetical protein